MPTDPQLPVWRTPTPRDVSLATDLAYIRRSGTVTRFHIHRRLLDHSIGLHSWNVANIVQAVAPGCRKEVILAAMWHDVPEYTTGDPPADFKYANPEIAAGYNRADLAVHEQIGTKLYLTAEERALLKWADIVDLAAQSLDEIEVGNRIYWPMFTRAIGLLGEKFPEVSLAQHAVEGGLEDRATSLNPDWRTFRDDLQSPTLG